MYLVHDMQRRNTKIVSRRPKSGVLDVGNISNTARRLRCDGVYNVNNVSGERYSEVDEAFANNDVIILTGTSQKANETHPKHIRNLKHHVWHEFGYAQARGFRKNNSGQALLTNKSCGVSIGLNPRKFKDRNFHMDYSPGGILLVGLAVSDLKVSITTSHSLPLISHPKVM